MQITVSVPIRRTIKETMEDYEKYGEAVYVRPSLYEPGEVVHIFHKDGSMTGYFPEDNVTVVSTFS